MRNYLKLGDWNARCDSCGRKFKASMLQQRWDGLMVCKEDWETRHPSDFLRVQRERISVPFARPETSPDTFINESACSIYSVQAAGGVAVAGCAITGRAVLFIPSTQNAITAFAVAGYAITGRLY
jgi:hypothetical protein